MREFSGHVAHAVEQHRRNEQKLKNHERELQRRLTQLQLDELVSKKKKVQAALKEADEPTGVMAAVNTPNQVLPPQPVQQAPQVMQRSPHATQQAPVNVNQNTLHSASQPQQPNAPIVIYMPEQQGNRNRGMMTFGRGRGRGRGYYSQPRDMPPPNVCWGCSQPGHNRRNCPVNPWPQEVMQMHQQ